MFRWSREHSVEVNLPIRKVWDFYITPGNWPKWMDQLESCTFEGELQVGTIIKAKVKNRNAHIQITMTELKLHGEYGILIKVPFFIQESSDVFREISPEKTLVITKTSITSLLAPIMKLYFNKKNKQGNLQCLKALLEMVKNESQCKISNTCLAPKIIILE